LQEQYSRIPIIELYDQLVVPLQGDLTDQAAGQMTQDVLERIRTTGAKGLVIDLTGVWMLDSHLCSVLSQLAMAARLMGTRSVICGMNPDTAMTLQMMGVDLKFTQTALRLEAALERLGVRVISGEHAEHDLHELPEEDVDE
jgi:rsbT antagonist protein RsbS